MTFNSNPIAIIKTNRGTIKIELFKQDAPKTVKNFINYVKEDFYRWTIFHRVIKDFVIQGGGFKPGMIQKEPLFDPIKNETSISKHKNKRGTIAMARTSNPDSATSQFYINLKDNESLDWDKAKDGHGYCVFGEVVEGLNVVYDIGSIKTHSEKGYNDVPIDDVIIKNIKIN
ncbi:MAG: peptidylprolyl isomerase [Thermoplasmatota archaeon]